jgi:hypothetical protein
MPRKQMPELEHKGSLIIYQDEDGKDTYLGALFFWPGHGCFDPTFGKVDVTQEEAETHNRLLDEAMLAGLDESPRGVGGDADGDQAWCTWCAASEPGDDQPDRVGAECDAACDGAGDAVARR